MNSTEQTTSNEKKNIIYNSVDHVFKYLNEEFINKDYFVLGKLEIAKYNDNIDKENDYYFNKYLEKRNVDIIYIFCSDNDKDKLFALYYIVIKENNNNLKEFLEMNFGEFLYDEYKKKYSDVIIEEELKFPNSTNDKIIETFPNYEEINKIVNLNESEIKENNNINNKNIKELIKKYYNQKNNSQNSTSNNTNNNSNNNNNNFNDKEKILNIEISKIISN